MAKAKSNFFEWVGKPNETSARMKVAAKPVAQTPYYDAKSIPEFLDEADASEDAGEKGA